MSSSIITIQLGNYANFIGSHYWNLHEYALNNNSDNSIDSDVHYCEGLTSNNVVTYTPRLISMDWKENLGANVIDDIYEEIENEGISNVESRRDINSLKVHTYSGKVDIHTGFSNTELNVNKRKEILSQTDYGYWNDYLYSRYHPRSLIALPKLHRGFDRDNFRIFSQGLELASNREFRDLMEEQTRYFVEKCDMLQGFQLLCDNDSGFSGVTTAWLDHLHDEYHQPVVSMPVSQSHNTSNESLFNTVSLLTSLNNLSVVTMPLSVADRHINNVSFNTQSQYHTAGILALAVKSLLLPCVLREKMYSLCDLSSLVNGRNNSLVSLALSLPLPLLESDSLLSTLNSTNPNSLFSTLNPYSSSITTMHTVIGNIYGVSPSRILSTNQRQDTHYGHCSLANDIMNVYIDKYFHPSQSNWFARAQSVPLSTPFPAIFSSSIDRLNGELISSTVNQNDDNGMLHCPRNVPLSTMLYTDDSSDDLVSLYHAGKDAVRRNKMCDVLTVTERDTLTDVLENFRNML